MSRCRHFFQCFLQAGWLKQSTYHQPPSTHSVRQQSWTLGWLSLLGWLALSGPLHAVSLSESGQGEVLILPYYVVRDGNDTLVVLTNHHSSGAPKAIKLRLLEAENGRPLHSFNLYLPPAVSWSFSLTELNGLATLRSQDGACILPAADSVALDSSALQAAPDSGRIDDERAKEGYIEIIEMGVALESGPGAGARFEQGAPVDCGQISAAWDDGGVWDLDPQAEMAPPNGGLSALAVFINVPGARAFAYRAVALKQFYRSTDAGQPSLHRRPEDAALGLEAATPATSQIWYPGADGLVPVEDQWESGAQAVSAVLMGDQVNNGYAVEQVIDGRTEWVLNFPTKHALAAVSPAQAPFTQSFDEPALGSGDGRACELTVPRQHDRNGLQIFLGIFPLPIGARPPDLSLCYAVNVLSYRNRTPPLDSPMANAAQGVHSDLLGSQLFVLEDLELFLGSQTGWTALGFNGRTLFETEVSHQLINPLSGRIYYGLPVIGFAAQSAEYRALNALYGTAFEHQRQLRLSPQPVAGSAQ